MGRVFSEQAALRRVEAENWLVKRCPPLSRNSPDRREWARRAPILAANAAGEAADDVAKLSERSSGLLRHQPTPGRACGDKEW